MTGRVRQAVLAAALAVGMAGCDEKLSDVAGPTPDLEPTFSSIQREIFNTTDSSGRVACIQCHSDNGRVTAGTSCCWKAALIINWSDEPAASSPAPSSSFPTILTAATSFTSSKARRHHRAADASHHRPVPDRRADQHHSSLDRTWRAQRLGEPDVTYFVRCTLLVLALGAMIVPTASAQTPTPDEDDPDRDPNDRAARLLRRDAQHQPAAAEGQDGVPADAPLPAHARRRRLRRPRSDDFFGLDSGAQIGLELQVRAVPRRRRSASIAPPIAPSSSRASTTSSRTATGPIGLGVVVNVDGTDNFSDEFSPGVALVLSRELGEHGALYFQPSWVGNTNLTIRLVDDDYTVMVGPGRAPAPRPTIYLPVREGSPRLAGYDPGRCA